MATAATPDPGTTVARAAKPAAVAPRDAMKQELARFVPSYEKLLPKGYTGERLVTGALVAIAANPDLLKCDPTSVALALARIAQWGLDVGTTAHLVPFGRTCTPIPDYKGLIELLCAAGCRKVEAREVRAGEAFEYQYGTEPMLRHQPSGSDRPIVAAYAIAWLRGGVTQFEVMTADEINAVRKQSKSWSKGDLTYWYARKTALRRLAKYVGKSPRLAAVLQAEAVDVGEAEEPTDDLLQRLAPAPAYRPAHLGGDGYDARPARAVTGGVPAEIVDTATKARPQGPLPDDSYDPGDAAEDDRALDRAMIEREGQ